MSNLFEGAQFGDRYQLRNGQTATFLWESCGTASMLLCDEIPEGYIGYYEPDGVSGCGEEWDIAERIGPWKETENIK